MEQLDKAQLYNAFARLIYAVTMADGIVQKEEMDVIRKVVGEHPMMGYIDNYFRIGDRKISIIKAYYEVLTFIQENKPDPEFSFLLKILEELSKLSEGVHEDDENLMEEFIEDLRAKVVA